MIVSDFTGPGDALAALEDWGGGPELSLGRKLDPGEVGCTTWPSGRAGA